MTLFAIVCLTLLAGTGSVWLSDMFMRSGQRIARLFDRSTECWQAAAAGALLATAFLYVLPESLEGANLRRMLAVVLFGLAIFFALDRAEVWHHGHEHAGAALYPSPRGGVWSVLGGDALHAFGDGILIAAAFAADARTGLVAAMAVTAHEIPHHAGDLAIVRAQPGARDAAVTKVSIAGSFCVLGGIAGWWLAGVVQGLVPYLLALAASSFIYVALADLVPQLQRPVARHESAAQLAWLLAGVFAAAGAGRVVHGH